MKVTRTENSVELTPENDFEKECLEKIWCKRSESHWEDEWEQRGKLIFSWNKDPWDDRR